MAAHRAANSRSFLIVGKPAAGLAQGFNAEKERRDADQQDWADMMPTTADNTYTGKGGSERS